MFELIITGDKKLYNNPKELSKIILGLSKDIELCKNDITTIQNRNWFERLFNNNTRDLATAMLKQQDTLSILFQIVQCLLVMVANNYRLLAQLSYHLKEGAKDQGLTNNIYFKMANRQVEATMNSQKKTKKSFDTIFNRHGKTDKKVKIHSKLLIILSLGELLIIAFLLYKYLI